MKKIAMIPVLLGSTRIPDKNLILVNGYPMIFYVVKACKESKAFDEIVINSEHLEFKYIADMFGVNFYLRDPKKGGSKCSMSNKSRSCNGSRCQVHDHYIIDFIENNPCDYLIQVHTTSPLIKPETLKNFTKMLTSGKYDSCFCVENKFKEVFFNDKPLNFSKKIKTMTQELKPIQLVSWAISGWKTESFKTSYYKDSDDENGPTFCGNIGLYPISKIEALDADDKDDLFIIESVLDHRKKESNFLKHKFTTRITEIDSNLERLIYRDGVKEVKELKENNDKIFVTSFDKILDENKGDSWCYPLFYNMNDQICLIKQNKNEGCRKHYHVTKGEWWLVVKGSFKWVLDDGTEYNLNPGELIYLPPGTIHQIFCTSETPGVRMAGGIKDMEHIYVE